MTERPSYYTEEEWQNYLAEKRKEKPARTRRDGGNGHDGDPFIRKEPRPETFSKALKANQPRRHYVASRRADDVRSGTPPRDTRRGEWIERTRAVTIEAEVNRRGLRLLRQGHEFVGPCMLCREGTDRFSINPKENVWFCRRCDRGGGDALSLVEFLDGLDLKIAKDFTWACQTLTGEAPPSAGGETTAQISAKRGNSKYPGKPIIVERFDYVDKSDGLLYQVQRAEFEGPDGERILKDGKRHKIFWQRRPDPNRPGEFVDGIDGVRLVPFRLPELL